MIVWAQVRLPGWHHWPDAPPHRSYLASSHRHMFHVRAEVRVQHAERQIEFHDLQDAIRMWWPEDEQFGAASCETIGTQLGEWLLGRLGISACAVEVSEDGEAGARVTVSHWP